MRIAIVNDVPLACEALRRVILSKPGNELAWTARDGVEAVGMARRDRPDLILMDLIMPKLDGAEATRQIMADTPCAILVVTATVTGHMTKVFEAMGHGALDAVDTPSLSPQGQVQGAVPLLDKIALISNLISTPSGFSDPPSALPSQPLDRVKVGKLVLLGASTGGPKIVGDILSGLPADFDACVIVVQHVDVAFAAGLAHWFEGQTPLPVKLIREGDRPEPGTVKLAATNDHLVLTKDRSFSYTPEPQNVPFRPSVDVFFRSVATHWPDPGVAVILSGMGRDGANGLFKLRRVGWSTIAQDQSTSVVWGMPRAAIELNAAKDVLPVGAIAGKILEQTRRLAAR
jgi:two-component system response regulator WspF